jgi:hypothetical protein
MLSSAYNMTDRNCLHSLKYYVRDNIDLGLRGGVTHPLTEMNARNRETYCCGVERG